MDSLQDIMNLLDGPSTKRSSKKQKRKWREIEALKDKHRLRKELQELDFLADDIAIEELDF